MEGIESSANFSLQPLLNLLTAFDQNVEVYSIEGHDKAQVGNALSPLSPSTAGDLVARKSDVT